MRDDRAGRPILERPGPRRVTAVVLASRPDGALYRLDVRIPYDEETDMVGEALYRAQNLTVSRTERLRAFEVLTIGGNRVYAIH